MDDSFCICLTEKSDTILLQFFFKFLIILYDPVVYHIGVLSQVWVGIELGRFAVCCPACVPDGDTEPLTLVRLGLFSQVLQFSDGFEVVEFLTFDDSDSCRVVASVLKLLQSVQKDLFFLFGPNVSNNSTHIVTLPYSVFQ